MKRIATLAALASALATAQESIHSASISGRVIDPSGGAVQAARVTARHLDTNTTRATVSDGEGRFRFPYLAVGDYTVSVQAAGFSEAVRPLRLTIGSAFEIAVPLTIGPAQTEVNVTGQAAALETARSQIAGVVSQREARALPLNGRNFLDLALLLPGVSPTNTASTQLFPETSAVPGQGLSIASQRNFSNSFLVDGLSANDDAAGLSGMVYGLDVVQEFQVVTSGGNAELGRALGGYISLVTKSGANTLHGDLYGYLRNRRFNAANALSHNKLPFTQTQYGAGLGGPIVRDRAFYFTNVEQRRLNQAGLAIISPANVALINARLTEAGYGGPPVTTGLYANPVSGTTALGKIDYHFSARDQFSVRYSRYDVNARNARGAGGLNAPTASSNLDNSDHAIAASNVLTLSPRTVYEARGQATWSRLLAPPSEPIGPFVSIAGVAAFGTSSGSPTGRENRLYEVVNNISHQRGAHAIRAGANLVHNETTITYPRAIRGTYSFSSLSTFLSGTYNNLGFSQTFGSPSIGLSNPNLAFYAQDEWKAASGLTLNVGVRYDLQFLETIATDTNNISPRAGFAWSPWRSSRTVFRGSAGLFYDRVPLRALANALLSAGNTTDLSNLRQVGVSLSPTQAGAPRFPSILPTAIPSITPVNLTTMDRRMQNAYSRQVSFEMEQQVGQNGAFSVGYQNLRGLRLIAAINQNVPECAAQGSNNGCRPNPNYGNNNQYSSAADSQYSGLHLSFVQRPARWSQFRISYTYSKAMNNVGEFFFSAPIDPYNIWRDWGRSDDDQRHRLVMQGFVESGSGGGGGYWRRAARGLQLSGFVQYYSALPFNVLAGTTTVQGTAARPMVNGDFIPRNAGTGFDFLGVNVRLTRRFAVSERVTLEALAETFNALNQVNGITRNATFGGGAYPSEPLPSFGQTTAVADPRSWQFALRVRF